LAGLYHIGVNLPALSDCQLEDDPQRVQYWSAQRVRSAQLREDAGTMCARCLVGPASGRAVEETRRVPGRQTCRHCM